MRGRNFAYGGASLSDVKNRRAGRPRGKHLARDLRRAGIILSYFLLLFFVAFRLSHGA